MRRVILDYFRARCFIEFLLGKVETSMWLPEQRHMSARPPQTRPLVVSFHRFAV